MKQHVQHLNEFLAESEIKKQEKQLNEDLGNIIGHAVGSMFLIYVLINFNIAVLDNDDITAKNLLSKLGIPNPVKSLKTWFIGKTKKKEIQAVIDRLKDDKELLDVIKNQDIPDYIDLLKKKLSPGEIKLLSNVTSDLYFEIGKKF